VAEAGSDWFRRACPGGFGDLTPGELPLQRACRQCLETAHRRSDVEKALRAWLLQPGCAPATARQYLLALAEWKQDQVEALGGIEALQKGRRLGLFEERHHNGEHLGRFRPEEGRHHFDFESREERKGLFGGCGDNFLQDLLGPLFAEGAVEDFALICATTGGFKEFLEI